ncbi:MAG: DNA polymerase III subunit delta [Pseudomonadota bacterium]
MKLSGGQAAAYFAKPSGNHSGVLLYGGDAMRVSLKRQALIKALTGPNAEEEMRLTRMTGADLRKDGSAALDAVKAVGFFPGARVVFVDGVGDGLTDTLSAVLEDWAEGDATLVCTAGQLAARSKLRKLFEGAGKGLAIGIYDDPASRSEIEEALKKEGLGTVPQPVMNDLIALSRTVDPGELMQIIQKLGLYKHGDSVPLTAEDITAVMPTTTDADADDAFHAAAEGRTADMIVTLSKLAGQGVTPTALCINATRHFKTLHAVATNPGAGDAIFARNRVFGPRRDRLARQANRLGVARLEKALKELLDTDLALRSTRRPPEMAAVERAFVRIAMLRRN